MSKNILGLLVLILVVAGIVMYIKKTGTSDRAFITDVEGSNAVPPTSEIVASRKSQTLGEYLTDMEGRTLYTFSDDGKSKSNCINTCLTQWPVFKYDNKQLTSFVDVLSKRMNIIERSDGVFQYSYGEKPVYYYAEDKKPGDMNGQGLNSGKWSIIKIN